ncbi:MAG: hypothetical protein HY056_09950 [Proteobacteria bacterium]|nr:hypothetical protein [Pseudomonadota bacterium]
MELATDNLLARVLLTLNTLGYSLGPAIADFNRTHATNPLWTPHARFHVVWQVTSYLGVGILALGLIWVGGASAPQRLWLAAALAVAIYASFYLTLFLMPRYGGGVADVNGVAPLATLNIGGRAVALDTNVSVFTLQVAVLVFAIILIR